MDTISLNGSWQITCADRPLKINGTVPGDVHAALLGFEEIPDPFYRDNEEKLEWIGDMDWTYSRSFEVSADLLAETSVKLVCDGLDTIATVKINGREAGKADNMHRTWKWEVKELLKEGENTITVTFASAVKYAKQANERELPLKWNGRHNTPAGIEGFEQGPYQMIRKEACNFGWDWGIRAVTCGIWKDIALVGLSDAKIDHLQILQAHREGTAVVKVKACLERLGTGACTAKAVLSKEGQLVAEGECLIDATEGEIKLVIENPELWWPNNMGDQVLHDLEVTLEDASGQVLDERSRRVGLRTIELDRHKDEWGESFQFKVNGIAFFAKGANWIPVDAVLAHATRDDYERLIRDSAAVNMNMLRIWGGGIYEADTFYELCSEYGILVWQDFMFACNPYPVDEAAFRENARQEAIDQVKRLHHHASLALWCGNNELEQISVKPEWTSRSMSWKDYCLLFDTILAEVVAEYHPGADYWPSSPHTTMGNRSDINNPESGDAHLWDVWHGNKPFEWYRTTSNRFCSEYGFQSFPEPKTCRSYSEPHERNVTSRIMEYHQRSRIGNATIMEYMLRWYRLPVGFENTVWASQIQQGVAIKYAVEHWRRIMPRCMGSLYWQLNDYWPVASWSSIDYHGRWKALHYMARQFYAPILVSGIENMDTGTAEVHVSSDLLTDTNGTVTCTLTDLKGIELFSDRQDIAIRSNQSAQVQTLELKGLLDKHGASNVVLWLDLETESGASSRNLVLFCRPKHMDLVVPTFGKELSDNGDGSFTLKLTADSVALWTWLELTETDAVFSDSFFSLSTGATSTIRIEPREPMTLAQVEGQLVVKSLVDTYRE